MYKDPETGKLCTKNEQKKVLAQRKKVAKEAEKAAKKDAEPK